MEYFVYLTVKSACDIKCAKQISEFYANSRKNCIYTDKIYLYFFD